MRPWIGWSPIRFFDAMLTTGNPTFPDLFAKAKEFGVDTIELHHAMLPSYNRRSLDDLSRLLFRYGLRLSMLTCAPDFTHPDPEERARQLEEMKTKVIIAWVLGAEGVRVTIGCAHPGVRRDEGIRWAVEMLERLAEFAHPRGIQLGLENHYKDRLWDLPDFGLDPDIFLEVVERLKGTPIGVNFDCANPLMVHRDPLSLLRTVKDRVWHVHVSDRKAGEYAHQVLGEGEVPLEALMEELAKSGFQGVLSLEDGQEKEGDKGTKRSLAFLRAQVEKWWK